MAGVAGAAIVSGELILSLDDGTIIRAGYVQGPTGLTGPQGPMGATGRPGLDGNGLLHGAGTPQYDDGKDGDFYIDIKTLKFYGPKTNGRWGSGVALLPKDRGQTLLTGMKAQGSAAAGRFFAAGISGPSSGGIPSPGGTGNLQAINGNNKPLASGAPVIDPVSGAVTTPATWTVLAADLDGGDAMVVDVYAEGPNGAQLVEVAAMRDNARRTGYSQVYEIQTGTPPKLTFQVINDASGFLSLQMYSDQSLTVVRGRVLYI